MILHLQGVAAARGNRLLFNGLDLALGPGGAAVVTGSNGVGKSSLLRLCAGLLRPLEGTVAAAPCALLGEQAALDGERTLRDALGFWASLDGRHDQVDAALEAVDMADLAAVPVRLLSTGQRRRAGLARVVVSGTPLWLLDEPANGLDDAAVARLEALIAAHRAGGGAALVATHLPLAIAGAIDLPLGGRA